MVTAQALSHCALHLTEYNIYGILFFMSETLETVRPEERLADMQALLPVIIESEWSDLEAMAAFMRHYNAYEILEKEDFEELCEDLNIQGKVYWSESAFDYMVNRYHLLDGVWAEVEIDDKKIDQESATSVNWIPAASTVRNVDGSTEMHRFIAQAVVFSPQANSDRL
jgi:hypothetical protein